jgi:GntR family carbon starvation induced transcriptional regulator
MTKNSTRYRRSAAARYGSGPDARTLAELAYQRIRNDIVAGVLKPEEKLRIVPLAKRYGVGPSPLREALSRLSSDYLVVAEGQRGFHVSPIGARDAADISAMRCLIECEAVRQAVQHGDEAWESRIVAAYYRLQKADQRLREGQKGAVDEWEERNRDFHEAIVSACDALWLRRLQQLLFAQHERYRRLSLQHPPMAKTEQRSPFAPAPFPGRDLDAEHRSLMEACLARDGDRAAELLRDHIQATTLAIAAILDPAAPPPPSIRRRRVVTHKGPKPKSKSRRS